ncbi:MAG: nucleotidyl transferase AbiEii/AbiGii toxin family protein [Flavobacteriales bacterium]|jgi:predicted nucleotidyltransferase component of viral defense system|nr:nucleotidyl transferase AbiEii/AbiGii toxin family protein [Flavobacteriales bacterium]
MLHYNTIEKPTLELLKKLQQTPVFSDLRLVDGTSLTLQIGHRISVDLDLFGRQDTDEIAISNSLRGYKQAIQLRNTQNIHVYLINGIKVDLVNYPYPWLDDMVVIDKLKLASIHDIAAMKIAAVTGRGSKKDFIDIYFLLKQMTLIDILKAYEQKFDDGSQFMALKSLIYFEDAEEDEMPVMLKPLTWNQVKDTIRKAHLNYIDNINN